MEICREKINYRTFHRCPIGLISCVGMRFPRVLFGYLAETIDVNINSIDHPTYSQRFAMRSNVTETPVCQYVSSFFFFYLHSKKEILKGKWDLSRYVRPCRVIYRNLLIKLS